MLKNFFQAENRLNIECVILFSLLAVFFFTNFYQPGKKRKDEVLKQEKILQNEVRSLKKQLAALEDKCMAFKSNEPITIEKAIRDEFGWGKQGEVVLALPADDR
ncbi:MAG: hypothetical protein ACYTFY_02755 [Planctomycetota bacterium]